MKAGATRRFRLRYSLRLLLILMLVGTVLMAWYAAPMRRQRAAVANLVNMGAEIGYAGDLAGSDSALAGRLASWLRGAGAPWKRSSCWGSPSTMTIFWH